MKRSPIKSMSTKRRKLTSDRAKIRAAVFERDGGCLLAGYGPCFGGLTPHHVVKASQGGAYSLSNLRALCALHNDRLEADADLARIGVDLGLVVRRSA